MTESQTARCLDGIFGLVDHDLDRNARKSQLVKVLNRDSLPWALLSHFALSQRSYGAMTRSRLTRDRIPR